MENVQLNLPTGSAATLSNLRPDGYHERWLQMKTLLLLVPSWSEKIIVTRPGKTSAQMDGK
jgi:hypothetical protein